jgi:hypothetical protein
VIDAGKPSPDGVFINMDACLSRANQIASVLAMLHTLTVLNPPQ